MVLLKLIKGVNEMKFKRTIALLATAAMAVSFVACGSSPGTGAESGSGGSGTAGDTGNADNGGTADAPDNNYTAVVLGETGKDIKTKIKILTHRTDMVGDDYSGKSWKDYVAEFNKIYPEITVEFEAITDYAEDSLLRLQGGDWGDIMMIPAIDASELSNYFMPYGTVDQMKGAIRFATDKQYNGICYGVPSTGNAQGVLYNKAVFEKAGITTLPRHRRNL